MSGPAVFALLFVVMPALAIVASGYGEATGIRLLQLPARLLGLTASAAKAVCYILLPLAAVPLLLFAAGIVSVVPGVWAVVLALGLGRWLLRS